MDDIRPNPIDILNMINEEEQKKSRGKLKIFFGYAAGVGKTYAMLEAAHKAKSSGVDVVCGYVEPHLREETSNLLNGLEILPTTSIKYKEKALVEFDLDGAIKRNPKLILVDELAHTNVPGSRHLKRYQDIDELLNAGIDVYTTINVQHIESLNDIVAKITGVKVRERIPDRVFDEATQVELVDIEPDDLIERLMKGKIYKENQAQRALKNFFIKENLIALREIALRRTADQVSSVVERARNSNPKIDYTTNSHILICLSSSPSNSKVIRTAARMASAFHCPFTALFVETPDTKELSDENKDMLRGNLKLAEQLGAKIATVYGDDIPSQIAQYAIASGVSQIVIGQTTTKKKFFKSPTFVQRLSELAPNLDIYIIPDTNPSNKRKPLNSYIKVHDFSIIDFTKALFILILSTLIGFVFYSIGYSEANIITVYILSVLITSMCTEGKIYSTVSSVASVFIFNFLFVEPRYSLIPHGDGYQLTFLVMFTSAFLTSTLTKRVKSQAKEAALKAFRTEVLLETTQKLQRATNRNELYSSMASQVIKLLNRPVIIYPVTKRQKLGKPLVFSKNDGNNYINPNEKAVAEWVFRNNKNAGATTNTLPSAKCLYLSVRSNATVFAVIAVGISEGETLDYFEKNLFLAMLGEFALSLEKFQIAETKNEINTKAQKEQLRANLLRAISHDLRTPLTSISGSAGILMKGSPSLDDSIKNELYTSIYDDSVWLSNLVENILSVTRLEDSQVKIPMEGELVYDVILEALKHINRKSVEHNISISLDDELIMAKMDSRLIIQVLINIIDNAIKYTHVGSNIIITAKKTKKMVRVEILDDGEGISEDARDKLFDMFFTTANNKGDSRRGLGLGLTLCKSIILAHGGTISVKDNIPKGTVFSFTLQLAEVKINE
ncbi:MAG: DUF4118 domain-containing protein [Clostridium sp.]